MLTMENRARVIKQGSWTNERGVFRLPVQMPLGPLPLSHARSATYKAYEQCARDAELHSLFRSWVVGRCAVRLGGCTAGRDCEERAAANTCDRTTR
jgi:hypothetical protein